MKTFLANLGLTLGSVFFLLVFLELVILRLVLVPSDLPYLSDTSQKVLKYEPNQSGVYRVKNEIASPFRINKNGWNSSLNDYWGESGSNGKRICVVGDSYVESLQVKTSDNFSEVASRELGPEYSPALRFGISGSPLSHYIYMIENEVLQFDPDIVVVNLVHNDFYESWVPNGGTYDTSLARFLLDNDEAVFLSTPEQYRRDWTWWVKQSATFRYLWVRWKIRPQKLREFVLRGKREAEDEQKFVANIKVSSALDPRVRTGVDYAFNTLHLLEKSKGVRIILILDSSSRGKRSRGHESERGSPIVEMEEMVLEKANFYDLEIIDLAEVFYQDYKKNKIPFSFRHDGHWNSYAHRVVGAELARVVSSNKK